jgi:hypothetical protein
MQTYANLISAKSFSPHMESVDFLKFLRVSIVIALILAALFSIRGNVLGLRSALEKNSLWLIVIGLAITSTSSILAMITVIKVEGLRIVSRVLIGVVSVMLFYVSGRLTYLGFVGQEAQSVVNTIQENPELANARAELNRIIERQNQYEILASEKQSLLAREREQRGWIREIEKRLIIENRNKKSNVEASLGEERKLALMMFSFAPEMCLAVLSPLVVILFSAGCGLRDERRIDQGEAPGLQEKIIYVPVAMQGNNGNGVEKVEKPGVPVASQAELASIAQNQGQGNGKAAVKQLTNWNPFQ